MLYNLMQILAFSKLFFNNKKSERKTEFEHTRVSILDKQKQRQTHV